MALVNKRVTPDELAERLAMSRKIMHKVDTDTFERGNIDESKIISEDSTIIEDEKPIPLETISKYKTEAINENKIKESKLPDTIKQAMLEHPIPQISLNDGLDLDLVKKVKKIMENDGSLPKSSQSSKGSSFSNQINETKLEKLIENAVRKVLDEKINQILAAQQLGTINENLVLKVGDSIFQGKITGVKSSKIKK